MCKYEGVMPVTGTATQTAGGRKSVKAQLKTHVQTHSVIYATQYIFLGQPTSPEKGVRPTCVQP